MNTPRLCKIVGLNGLKDILEELQTNEKRKESETFSVSSFECRISFDDLLGKLNVAHIELREENGDSPDPVYSETVWVEGIQHYIDRKEKKGKQKELLEGLS